MVYSPSSTATASTCLRKWNFARHGVKPTLIYYPELCAVIGEGVAAGLAHFNLTRLRNEPAPSLEACVEVGKKAAGERLANELAVDRRVNLLDREFADTIPSRVAAALALYFDRNPLNNIKILSVEESFPDHGNARPDLIGEDVAGKFILDYKVKVKLLANWKQKELDKYRRSPQLYHYAWMTGISRYMICLIVLGPQPYIHIEPYTIAPDYAGIWLRDAQTLWGTMETIATHDIPIAQTPGSMQHSTPFGECEYAQACLEQGLDQTKMMFDYVVKGGKSCTNS